MYRQRGIVFSLSVVSLPDNQVFLQYQWTFADILWKPDEINLELKFCNLLRRNRFTSIEALALKSGIPATSLYENPYDAVAQNLLQACHEFEALINNPETIKTDAQAFLEEPSHSFILSPVHKEIFPHKPLGGFNKIPDFTVLLPDGEYHFT